MKTMKKLAAVALALACAHALAAADAAETKKLHALFDSQWETQAREFPELSTFRGDYRYNDRLSDRSPAARAAYDAKERDWLRQARAIRRDKLSPTDKVSLDIFVHQQGEAVEEHAFKGYRSMLIGALDGAQTQAADLARQVPMEKAAQAQQFLKRFAAYPKYVDEQIVQMREGAAVGWVPAKGVLERALAQLDDQLAMKADDSPWFAPFKKLGADVTAAERDRLQAAAREAIPRDVVPPLRKLRAFIVTELVPRAPENGALRNYPDGAKVYDYLVRSRTTTNLKAEQVHAIGMRELAAIRKDMEGVMQQVKFEGSFPQFVQYLNTDPRFFYKDNDGNEMLEGYRAIGKRIDAELPRYFAELPRAPYGVRAMPTYKGPDAAEYYDQPAMDGSRPGYFNANVMGLNAKPKWAMATLTAHEAVPGHHLQTARSQEMGTLPKFRRMSWFVAYGEGWAVYGERLAREMGIFDNDPYSLFGHLQWQAFRAARLVVDTGIHSMGWSRQQAIDFMVERTGVDRNFVSSEVDRYTSDPGQALGYMIGALKIGELRQSAKARLGDKFEVRRFHNVVLDSGPVPLDVMEKLVDEWVAKEAARR
ncbi:DUF885 domain-containing protein [Ramlibacter sp. PS4R-6]|uniref:DUF885 domain-containing protein n=1 Tax=Ramlibacter sp. PS4R-6 TaxID=3133438 RepID=UPI0030A64705